MDGVGTMIKVVVQVVAAGVGTMMKVVVAEVGRCC